MFKFLILVSAFLAYSNFSYATGCNSGLDCNGGSCVNGFCTPECHFNSDCAGNEFCMSGSCTHSQRECSSNLDCGFAMHCTDDGVCQGNSGSSNSQAKIKVLQQLIKARPLDLMNDDGSGKCIGFADSCSNVGIVGEVSCRDQQGCRWNDDDQTCEGSAYDCSDSQLNTWTRCRDQSGCHWQDGN
jgi:hypothetical protein